MGAFIALVILGAAGAYVLTRPPAIASGAARLTIFNGTVQLKAAGNAASHAGATGEQLTQGEEITTGPSTRAAINFPDGSVTRMDANTQLTITQLVQANGGGWNVQLSQALGKTWNRVAQLVGGASFKVSGPNSSTAEVRGTDFLVTIAQNPDGSYSVRVDNFSGAID
ncbi:MAG TPA: FecR domain-containing protein, partial [Candidatus Dormibacteraeota bacterium]